MCALSCTPVTDATQLKSSSSHSRAACRGPQSRESRWRAGLGLPLLGPGGRTSALADRLLRGGPGGKKGWGWGSGDGGLVVLHQGPRLSAGTSQHMCGGGGQHLPGGWNVRVRSIPEGA